MEIKITVEDVVRAKFKDYLDTIPTEEERKKIIENYKEKAKQAIQNKIDEAKALLKTIETTIKNIQGTIAGISAQIASIAALAGTPLAAMAAQETFNLKSSVDSMKTQMEDTDSKFTELNGIVDSLSVPVPGLSELKTTISTVKSLLENIPL